ncbi:FG-GAP and VCBS repeat-containing protein [Streptomyces sp. GC420]|uniref:FG-GAP and VCBS repeat-containing protein n=1 Tax=Streptomyces sp. GC420 TaxID=2697568 RepID=UPI0028BE12BE|nr:FG-GAP and VCBS repeat-containing protein [Streptomyces sp. GC420]
MRARTSALLTVLVAAGLAPLATASPATAAVAKHYDDFNGDGYRDLAYGNEYSGGDGYTGGAVRIAYGTASGLSGGRSQLLHQDSPGIPGAGEEDDQWGDSLASADLNKDGYADLVVGNLSEHVGTHQYRGSVTIVWGSASGLSGGTMLTPRSGDAYFNFGRDLATGDFNGDGSPDLVVIGGSHAWLYRGGFTKSGTTGTVSKISKGDTFWASFGLAAGKVNGDGRTDLVILGIEESSTSSSGFRTRAWFLKGTSSGLASGASKTIDGVNQLENGPTAAIGDFDKDGYGDIALGDPDESSGKGSVTLWYGTSSGPSATRTKKLTQATSGVSGSPEAGDEFGRALSAADANGDGYADLAVGVPFEDLDGKEEAGGVHVFRGGSGGLSGSRSTWLTQATSGVAGARQAWDLFGHSLRLRDLDRDGRAELTVAANGDVTGNVLPGTPTGPTGTGSYTLPSVGNTFSD